MLAGLNGFVALSSTPIPYNKQQKTIKEDAGHPSYFNFF
jgi:hypothetical protein